MREVLSVSAAAGGHSLPRQAAAGEQLDGEHTGREGVHDSNRLLPQWQQRRAVGHRQEEPRKWWSSFQKHSLPCSVGV